MSRRRSSARVMYRMVLNVASAVLGAKRAKVIDARLRFGRRLNLDRPRTLVDKICWLEFNAYKDSPLVARCASKADVRGYLEEKGLADHLVPLCCAPWRESADVDVDALPRAFAMKAAHGSGMNRIVCDKSTEDAAELRATALRWLAEDYARACVEPHYLNVPHAVVCEKLLAAPEDIVDYKVHCLNGVARLVQTCSDRASDLAEALYDMDWRPVEGLEGIRVRAVAMPGRLTLMRELAEAVAADFPYVRVDFYEVGGHVYFGELTFTPATGVLPHFSDQLVESLGAMLRIPADGGGAA